MLLPQILLAPAPGAAERRCDGHPRRLAHWFACPRDRRPRMSAVVWSEFVRVWRSIVYGLAVQILSVDSVNPVSICSAHCPDYRAGNGSRSEEQT